MRTRETGKENKFSFSIFATPSPFTTIIIIRIANANDCKFETGYGDCCVDRNQWNNEMIYPLVFQIQRSSVDPIMRCLSAIFMWLFVVTIVFGLSFFALLFWYCLWSTCWSTFGLNKRTKIKHVSGEVIFFVLSIGQKETKNVISWITTLENIFLLSSFSLIRSPYLNWIHKWNSKIGKVEKVIIFFFSYCTELLNWRRISEWSKQTNKQTKAETATGTQMN